MSEYQQVAEKYNVDWSNECAKLLCRSKNQPEEEYTHYLTDVGDLRIPTMLYAVMVEVVRLSEVLLQLMAAAEIEKSQAVMSHLHSYMVLIKSIPGVIVHDSGNNVTDAIYSIVSRYNGRWPL